MPFPRPASPRRLLADLRTLFAAGERHRLLFLAIAVGMTSLIITGFIVESRSGILPGRQIVEVSDWQASRTDSEIVAQQKIDQREREAALAERRRQFQKADKVLSGLGI